MRGRDEQSPPFAAVQSQWARLVIAGFIEAGVHDVVVSPGSRSTPFLLAAAEAAEKDDRLRLYDVVDERAAAFFALGQARLAGRPSLLLCTSGTAAAHYLPAVIEAGLTAVPMLILSADRPLELTTCGANQTIDQDRLFGEHARAFVELGLADAHPGALRGARRRIAQAVFTATWPRPGAVHVNARARKPLEPPEEESGGEIERRVDALLARPAPRPHAPERRPREADLDALAAELGRRSRGVIVAGPAAASQAELGDKVAALSQRTGFPLLADLASQLRRAECVRIPAVETLLRSDAWPRLRPELVVQIGRTPTATAWVKRLAEEPPERHWVFGPHDWHDPESTATDLIVADLGPILDGLLQRLPEPAAESEWLECWRGAGAAAERAVRAVLEADAELSEAQAAAEAVRAVPVGGLLALGNSLAIRHADLYGGEPRRDVTVLSQRGASGIDGLVAGAAGAASISGTTSGAAPSARSGTRPRPTLVLLGDVSLQHDLGGLMTAPRGDAPFVVVVIDNAGGRIFEQLPIAGRVDGPTLDHWLTPAPPGTRDFAHAAAFAGFDYAVATSRRELRERLDAAFASRGPWLIHARVPPSGAAELRRRLDRETARALDGAELEPGKKP